MEDSLPLRSNSGGEEATFVTFDSHHRLPHESPLMKALKQNMLICVRALHIWLCLIACLFHTLLYERMDICIWKCVCSKSIRFIIYGTKK